MNMWQGVKLRVIEVWDDDGYYVKDLFYYEGWVVDIIISDKDCVKYGMLVKLVVEVGFDWVYFEFRGYIYCFVKLGIIFVLFLIKLEM